MNKTIQAVVWTAMMLLYTPFTSVLAQENALSKEEMAHYQQALELMHAPPLKHSGHNMWPALITWQQPHLSPDQREKLADEYVAQVNCWYEGYMADYLSDKTNQPQPFPPFPGERKLPSARDSVLCGFATRAANCVATVREQTQAVSEALAPYSDLIEQVAALAEYDYYHVPLPQHGHTRWPNFHFMRLPLSAHALAHIQGDSQSALAGLCRDANTGRMLIQHSRNLVDSMAGRRILADNVEVAAQIITELPLDTALPAMCVSAFARLSAQNISLCPVMRGEFASMRSYVELEKQLLEYTQIPTSDWDNALLVLAHRNSAMCLPQTQLSLLKDEKFALPPLPSFTWLKQCSDNNPACQLAQSNGPIYGSYVHRMQDTAAQLQLMQVLLWLRQHPRQPLTNDYLQTAIPANVYTSTQRVIKISDDGNALEIDAYAERASTNVRLALPKALR